MYALNGVVFAILASIRMKTDLMIERSEMFIMLSTYLARAGEEDAIIALHEDWQRTQLPKVRGSIVGELLRSVENPRNFVSIMRYESRESALALAGDPEQQVWLQRLASLAEITPVLAEYKSEWRVD